MNLAPPRGTRDLLNEDAKQFQAITQAALDLATTYGYTPAFTPIFEHQAVFCRAVGESSDIVKKEMYKLESRANKNSEKKADDTLVLRPEGTASIARALISNGLTQTLPQKFVYVGPMFRYERPQKGRYRQFYHFGVEHFGAKTPVSDAESIALAARLLKTLNVNVTLHINSLGTAAARKAFGEALVAYLASYKDKLSADSLERLDSNPLRILDSKSKEDQEVLQGAPTLTDYLEDQDKSDFDKVLSYLKALEIPYIIDQKLVRGLDYYTGTVFEFKCAGLGAQDAILAGGRYDGLVEALGGPRIPAIGWAMGIDRAMLASNYKGHEQPLFAIITVGDFNISTLKIAESLRHANINIINIEQASVGKAMKLADRSKAAFAIIYGEDEHTYKSVTVKTIHGSKDLPKESSVNINDLIEFCHDLTKKASN